MANVSSGNLRKQEELLKKYIEGERSSNILCVTASVAHILKEKYPEVFLLKREKVNKKLGLFIYVIKKRGS
ncbi:MAG: hypothetical protein J6M60_02860 [Clostridia bacterium]|nr:hypothetical protein [Clostridia bacterium]